jgi:hypothetical protein
MVAPDVQAPDKTIAQSQRIIRIVAKDFENVAIKAVQPVFGAHPDKPMTILHGAKHGIVREPLFHLVMTERVSLRLSIGPSQQKNGYGKETIQHNPMGINRVAKQIYSPEGTPFSKNRPKMAPGEKLRQIEE